MKKFLLVLLCGASISGFSETASTSEQDELKLLVKNAELAHSNKDETFKKIEQCSPLCQRQ